ncbi:MAG: hypothetical protein LC797_19390 [Chloroflexi bacterium]|nr:hypothetical protein [Chloroflexota bacterium]
MSIDDLNTFLTQYLRTQFDPSAPLPDLWPTGIAGVFLIFVMPTIVGIPLGVIMARDAGIAPLITAALYFASDLVLAVTAEPMVALLRWVGTRVTFMGRLGQRLSRFTARAGLQEEGVRGPLGLILVSFTVNPLAGRAAAAAAGHGFFSGWALAIVGDMLYFALIMASTLVLSSMFGDRLAIGAVLITAFLAPLLIRRLRRSPARAGLPSPTPTMRLAAANAAPPAAPSAARGPRKRSTHTGRRRSSRGLHQ